SFTGAAYRLDKHNVIVAIARDKILIDRDVRDRRGVAVNLSAPGADARASAGVPSARASARVQNARASARVVEARVKRRDIVDREVVQDSRIVTGLIQKDVGAYNRVLIELQRLRDLEDDEREAPRLLGEKLLEVMRQP